MDDPWGSPWASSDVNIEASKASPTLPVLPSFPPSSPAFGASLGIHAQKRIPTLPEIEKSPWADQDDDAFGDWAAADDSVEFGAFSTPYERGLPENYDDAKEETGANGLPSGDSGIHMDASPVNADLDRQSVSTTNHWDAHPAPALPLSESAESSALPRFISPLTNENHASADDSPAHEKESQALDTTTNTTSIKNQDADAYIKGQGEPEEAEASSTSRSPSRGRAVRIRVHVPSVDQGRAGSKDAPRSCSATSSRHSNDSTEDSRGRARAIPRAIGPAKREQRLASVQELVQMFDGLAQTKNVEKSPSSSDACASRSRSRKNNKEDTLDDTLGDSLKDPPEDIPEDASVTAPEALRDTEESIASLTAAHSDTATSAAVEKPADDSSIKNDSEQLAPSTVTLKKYGSLKFVLDGKKLNSLFAAEDTAVSTPAQSNAIIDEASKGFATISERRTWYRISRQGSARRHDAGDDENYRPVLWMGSTVQHETIKIVRRWMEEDSLSGKPTLGAGNHAARGNVFGWDSSAKPVELKDVYKRSSMAVALAGSQAASVPTSSSFKRSHGRNSSSTDQSSIPTGMAESPTVSFGWGSVTSTSTPTLEKPELAQQQGFKPIPGPLADIRPREATMKLQQSAVDTQRLPIHERKAMQPSQENGGIVAAANDGTNDDEDDEWGDMVSSPIENSTANTMLRAPGPVLGLFDEWQDAGADESRKSMGIVVPVESVEKVNSEHEACPASDMVRPDDEKFVESVVFGLPDLSYMSV